MVVAKVGPQHLLVLDKLDGTDIRDTWEGPRREEVRAHEDRWAREGGGQEHGATRGQRGRKDPPPQEPRTWAALLPPGFGTLGSRTVREQIPRVMATKGVVTW